MGNARPSFDPSRAGHTGAHPYQLSSDQEAMTAWRERTGGSRIADTLGAMMDWLRNAAARATRYVVQAVETHPIAAGMLVVGTVGTLVIVAPQATWPLIKKAAAMLAGIAGSVIASGVVEELRHICPGCWTGHVPGLACEDPRLCHASPSPAPTNDVAEVFGSSNDLGEIFGEIFSRSRPSPNLDHEYDGTGNPPPGYHARNPPGWRR